MEGLAIASIGILIFAIGMMILHNYLEKKKIRKGNVR